MPGMTREAWADLDMTVGGRPPPAADELVYDLGYVGDVGALGQAICHRLFSAGLDLDCALSLDGEGPAADRMRHAVVELDDAIKDLRHLMLAVSGPLAGAVPDGRCGDKGSGPR